MGSPVGSVVGTPMFPTVAETLDIASVTGYDIAIGGLGFNLAISKDRPYERATAQFRKEQYDTTSTTGDQSLTGYWTRGQLSFHGGAGVRFYDVFGGDEVLNRYSSSVGLDPFTSLGEVSLTRGMVQQFTGPVLDAVSCTSAPATVGSVAVLTATGAIKLVSSSGGVTDLTAGGTVVSLTAGGGRIYAAVGSAIKTQDGTTTLVNQVTHATRNWSGVYHAKGRLFLVDQSNRWYTAPATGAVTALTDADAFWVAPYPPETTNRWFLTETPGPVLLGRDSTIFAIQLADDGSVPVLSASTVAAQLATGERVTGLTSYLGQVVIATNRGVRAARLDASLSYGPLLTDRPTVALRVAGRGERVFLPQDSGGSLSALVVSLEGEISERVYPYATHGPLIGSPSAPAGMLTSDTGDLLAFTSSGLYRESTALVSDGTLYTGLHRMGTLEGKSFQSVKVRAAGPGGSIAVYRVYLDGSEALLHTIVLGESSAIDLDLREDSPLEALGLRFTLTPDANDPTRGPTLLGYQLRALPAPERNRMIRLPLLLMDVERAGRAMPTGTPGSAWVRLTQLEQMERDSGTVLYRDNRTGEVGEVFIESVEHRGETPPSAADSGFGGFVYVTLRMLT